MCVSCLGVHSIHQIPPVYFFHSQPGRTLSVLSRTCVSLWFRSTSQKSQEPQTCRRWKIDTLKDLQCTVKSRRLQTKPFFFVVGFHDIYVSWSLTKRSKKNRRHHFGHQIIRVKTYLQIEGPGLVSVLTRRVLCPFLLNHNEVWHGSLSFYWPSTFRYLTGEEC